MAHTRIADLTLDELREMIREVVIQSFLEIFGDPDEGLELSEDFKAELARALAGDEPPRTFSGPDVAAKLGLTW